MQIGILGTGIVAQTLGSKLVELGRDVRLGSRTADMVNPSLIPGDHDLFMCGNDADAKAAVAGYLREWFGWRTILDLGDITAARATEMYLPLWVRLYGLFGTPHVTVHVQHRATQATA